MAHLLQFPSKLARRLEMNGLEPQLTRNLNILKRIVNQ
jgi:hypothetical protein